MDGAVGVLLMMGMGVRPKHKLASSETRLSIISHEVENNIYTNT